MRALAAIVCALIVGGCGSGERDFTATDFVAAANAQGAGLVLGERLLSSEQEVEVYDVGFEAGRGAAADGSGAEAGASLTIAPDEPTAIAVYERCEATAEFVCYRAANAALVFEAGSDGSDLARVDRAIRALGKG